MWRAALAGLAVTALVGVSGAGTPPAGRVVLPSPVAEQLTGESVAADPDLVLHLRVFLSGRDTAGRLRTAHAVSEPDSPSYAHYLTSGQYRQRFGASGAQIAQVRDWLTGQGLTVTASTGHYLAVDATVGQAAAAFGTGFRSYQTGVAQVPGLGSGAGRRRVRAGRDRGGRRFDQRPDHVRGRCGRPAADRDNPEEALVLQQGAIEGIRMNFASGDDGDGSDDSLGTAKLGFPTSDAWATGVGGTSLAIGADGEWLAEYGRGDTVTAITGSGYAVPPPGKFLMGSGPAHRVVPTRRSWPACSTARATRMRSLA